MSAPYEIDPLFVVWAKIDGEWHTDGVGMPARDATIDAAYLRNQLGTTVVMLAEGKEPK